MFARRRILVQVVMQVRGGRREPREKPKRSKHAGQKPADPHPFARPFHNPPSAATFPPVASENTFAPSLLCYNSETQHFFRANKRVDR